MANQQLNSQNNTNQTQVQNSSKINKKEVDVQNANAIKKEAVEHKSIDSLPEQLQKADGILIYESAKKKLDISPDGKIYRQKWFNYLPFVSIITVLVYVNFVFGKTKCLKDLDARLFKKAHTWCNIIGFLIMPIVAFALWTFGTWLMYDVIPNEFGQYSNLWNAYADSVKNAANIQSQIACAIGGLFEIMIAPIRGIAFEGDPNSVFLSIQVAGETIPLNLIFLAVLILFTIVNPVNIIFTFIMNAKVLRFITVHESSAIYRYRK